jgi:hypothetical protein
MASINVATAKGKGAIPAHTSFGRMKDTIETRRHRANGHILRKSYINASEILESLYGETKDKKLLLRILSLARTAENDGRHDVAEATYLILHRITKNKICIDFALRAGEKACLPKN